MNKFEAAIARKYKTPQAFLRHLGLDEAVLEGDTSPQAAMRAVGAMIDQMDSSDCVEFGQMLRKMCTDSRGIRTAAKDVLERGKYPPDEVGDGRPVRRMGRDFLDQPQPGGGREEPDGSRGMAGDTAFTSFDRMFPGASRITNT
jgi:hypothetical protein